MATPARGRGEKSSFVPQAGDWDGRFTVLYRAVKGYSPLSTTIRHRTPAVFFAETFEVHTSSKVPTPPRRFVLPGRWRAFTTAALIVVAAVATGLPSQAQPRGGPGGPDGMDMFGAPPGHLTRRVDAVLDGVGVTPAQRAQIRQIVMAAAADLKAQGDAGRGLRQRGMQIFTAPTVDAGAAESVRQQMAAQQDQSSRRVLDAMLEIAKVLTPEQRAKIGARMQERQAVQQDRRQRMEQEHRPHTPPAPQKP